MGKAGGYLAAFHALTAGGLVRKTVTGRDAGKRATGFLPPEIPFRADRPVAVDLQIEVVFDSHRDRILHRQIELPASNEAVQPIRIVQSNLRQTSRIIRTYSNWSGRLLHHLSGTL